MKFLRPRAAIAILLLCCVAALSSCTDSTLQKIGKAELAVSTACSSAFQVVSTAAAANPPLISQADANNVVGVLLKIEQADAQAEAATQAISQLNAQNKADLLGVVQPLQTAITNLISTGVINIQDPGTRNAVLVALTAVQTAIATTVAIIQGVKA